MSRIRKIEIQNFRSIQNLEWLPKATFNCLIGPGDSGKSTILDAIDLCLGARRTISLTDADFHNLNESDPIFITLTLGDLEANLKNIDKYGEFLRGFDAQTGKIDDEPERDLETVLTVQLKVADDLEPQWSLISEKAETKGLSRNLSWADRVTLSPTRIGARADYNLAWRKGSVLNYLADERPDTSAALADAARKARTSFGEEAHEQLSETLKVVTRTAQNLGVPVGATAKAMLDATSVSFSSGTVSLHDENGIPLRNLGLGSTRLLVAGLQSEVAGVAPLILVDELEHGLEPHRIIRFIQSLGAKNADTHLQVFSTTHSPIALRELSANQLLILREAEGTHHAVPVDSAASAQGLVRRFPEAFLARGVVVCEGASEFGLIRGLDIYFTENGSLPIGALGVTLVDGGGSTPDALYNLATAFLILGYKASVFRDDDKKPTKDIEDAFVRDGGGNFFWDCNRALEDELFASLSEDSVGKLIDYAIEYHGEGLVDSHIRSASDGAKKLSDVQLESINDGLTPDSRALLAKAAKFKGNSWFKTIYHMENIGRDIVGPSLGQAEISFTSRINAIFEWARSV